MNKQRFRKILILWVIVFGVSFNLQADDNKINIVTEKMRVILPPSVAKSTSVYGTIKNTGDVPDTLINMSTDAGMIMLHKTEIENGMAQMNHIDDFVLSSGAELVLKPMSYHLMLMGINHDIIKKGGEVTIMLEFKEAGKVTVKVPVLEE